MAQNNLKIEYVPFFPCLMALVEKIHTRPELNRKKQKQKIN